MKRMIFATGNENKMVEIREILGELPLEILSMKQAGITADIVEDGKTFEENALIKAREVCKIAQEMVMADDSGYGPEHESGSDPMKGGQAQDVRKIIQYAKKRDVGIWHISGTITKKESAWRRRQKCLTLRQNI